MKKSSAVARCSAGGDGLSRAKGLFIANSEAFLGQMLRKHLPQMVENATLHRVSGHFLRAPLIIRAIS